jgi:RNA polymerase sigma-70 factor (ECF subfamily)
MPEFRYDPSRGSFKQWLLLITRRRIQDHLRKVYRSSTWVSPAEDQGEEIENAPSPSPPPDIQINAAWESEWKETLLQAALARVRHHCSPKHYQVFDYCALQRVPASDVARMLGMSVAQVYLAKHRVGRAVKRAAAELEAEMNRSRCF